MAILTPSVRKVVAPPSPKPIGTAPVTQPKLTAYSAPKPTVAPTVPMDQASKDARFVRDMEANKSLHDAGRLQHYVDIQKNNPNAVFGNEALKRFYNQKTGVQQPVAQTAQPTFDQNAFLGDMQNNINGMYDAQQQAQLAQLKASRDKAIGQVNLQDAQLAPQYAGMRNQADVVSQQNVQRLREMMASSGLQSSGENVSASVGLQSARQNSLNSLNTQEQQQHNDFAQRIADLNDPAQEQALLSQLQAQRAQALLDATNRANDVGFQRSTDQRNFDYQKGLDTWNQNHTTQRDTVGDQQWNTTRNDTLTQQSKDNAWREHTFNNMSASEKAQLAKDISQFGEDLAWKYYQDKQANETAIAQSKAQIAALTP